MPGRVPSASLDGAAAGLRAAAAARGDVPINSLVRNVHGLQRGRSAVALRREARLQRLEQQVRSRPQALDGGEPGRSAMRCEGR